MLYSVVCIIFLFAHPVIRKKAYRFFWLSHQLYVLFYILCMLHGLARITAAPKFWIFFAFPGVVFTIDKVRIFLQSCEIRNLAKIFLPYQL